MRVLVGTIASVGLAVAVAVAQPPVPRERAATLLPPQAVAPGELPPVARGSGDDFPPSTPLSSTPVAKSVTPSWRVSPNSGGSAPTWSTNTDQTVVPATSQASNAGRVISSATPDDPSFQPRPQPKFLDRVKGTFTSDSKPAGTKQPVQNVAQPEQPTAATPFRATGANGAPVYAGPPAYRWYGWGSVTPGANPLAPAGQYPKASANWYAITGATPGAFPVPVGNTTARTVVGTEPPSYGLAARTPPAQQQAPAPTQQSVSQQQPTRAVERQEPPRFNPGTGSKFMPGPDSTAGATQTPAFNPAPVGVPTLTPPPVTKPVATATVPTPTLPPPPSSVVAVKEPGPSNLPPLPELPKPELLKVTKDPEPAPPSPKPDQAAASPPAVLPPLPIPLIAAAPPVEPARVPVPVMETRPVIETPPANVPLPTAVTNNPLVETRPANVPLPTAVTNNPPHEELRWQQSAEPVTPAPGTWAPAPGATPLPTVPATPSGAPAPVARGQVGDQQPDPITTLIKQVCQGRAEGVEVRWTGTKKLSVCFEVHTRAEAQKLVNDISRRPELVSYQIDFCVLVR